MIVTVSTVKDDLAAVEQFVNRNTARCVDHMVVFLDSEQLDVEAFCVAHPRVSVVTARDWWGLGPRPKSLNNRQTVNAGAVNTLLTMCPWATWLFHIDGDEVLDVDPLRLQALPADVQALELEVLEVANGGNGGGGSVQVGNGGVFFKRIPSEDELVLLQELDFIAEASVQQYFRGHLGKAGLRPNLDYTMHVHRPFDGDQKVMGLQAPWARMLHLESETFESFERKWINLLTSSPAGAIGMRPARRRLAVAIGALLQSSASDNVKKKYLHELYESSAVDRNVAGLAELGLLEEVDLSFPTVGRATPSAVEVARLEDALREAASVSKSIFRSSDPVERRSLNAKISRAWG